MNARPLSTVGGVYRYRLNGRIEELPLRVNHFWNGQIGGGISSLSLPEVIGRGKRRITYVYRGKTWVTIYRRECGEFVRVASYVLAGGKRS